MRFDIPRRGATYAPLVGAGLAIGVGAGAVVGVVLGRTTGYPEVAWQVGLQYVALLAAGGLISSIVATRVAMGLPRDVHSASRHAILATSAGNGAALVPGLLLLGLPLGLVGLILTLALAAAGAGVYYWIIVRSPRRWK